MSQKSSSRLKTKRRSGDPWVSNNRVLNSTSTTKKGPTIGRNPNFDTDETKLLIQLWGDPKVQRTLIIAHKKHAVLCDLASKMQTYGYFRSPEEISTRIKNLKCFYNRLKKEIESGLAAAGEPTWKHYAEMDAIMKRPIFSVRPNEVPPPSLKYQLEKAREEREERRKKLLEEGGAVSESDDGLDELVALSNGNGSRSEIDDGIIPDVEVDINDEAFAAIASAAEKTVSALSATKRRKASKASEGSLELGSEYGDEHEAEMSSNAGTDMGDMQIKEENDSRDSDEFPLCKSVKRKSLDSEKSTIGQSQKSAQVDANKSTTSDAQIKEEPIDVDAEEEIKANKVIAPKTRMPTLVERLASDSSASIILPDSIPMTIVSTGPQSMTKTSTITTFSTQTAPQGKISLVPTNFLMQPKPPTSTTNTPTAATAPAPLRPLHHSQIKLLPNTLNANGTLQPGRILLSGTTSVAGGAAGTPTSAGFVATGPGGMKLLLVNADQAGTQLNATNATLSQTLLPQINAAILQQQQKQQQQQQQAQQQQQQQQAQQQAQQKQQQLQQKQQQEKEQQQQQQLQQQQREKEEEQQQKRQQLKAAKLKAAKQRLLKPQYEKQRRDELWSRKEAANMRVFLRNIYNEQMENNAIQRQRLALERERLDFERSAVDRFFTELPKLFTQQNQQQQQQANVLQQQQQQVAAAMQAHTQQMRLNPPKLVFTTSAVQGMAGVAGGATILTPTKLTPNAMPKLAPAPSAIITQAANVDSSPASALASAQTAEVQLMTPKVENED